MLEFNPKNRPKASQLLNHPIFKSIRNEKVEKGALHRIHLDIDQIDSEDTNDDDIETKIIKQHRFGIIKIAN